MRGWTLAAKVVCQWLGSSDHRELLGNILKRNESVVLERTDPATLGEMLRPLRNGCDRFAEWRWKTLANVAADLGRLEKATRMSLSLVADPAALGTRDASTIKRLAEAVRDDAFWGRARGIAKAVAPLSEMSSWLRGCHCHEHLRRKKVPVKCPWAGCRAFQLATRLRPLPWRRNLGSFAITLSYLLAWTLAIGLI